MSAVKAIYAGVRALGIAEEEDRRDLFVRVTGKRRLREMTPSEKEAVVYELRRLGFKSAGKRQLEGPYAKKLQALWIAAWNLGLVRSRDDGALLAFVRRQTGIEHARFLVIAADANKAVEALKSWIARDGGVNWSDAERPNWLKDHGAKIAWAQWAMLHPGSERLSIDEFAAGVQTITGKRCALGLMRSADWRAVSNQFGEWVRAGRMPSNKTNEEE